MKIVYAIACSTLLDLIHYRLFSFKCTLYNSVHQDMLSEYGCLANELESWEVFCFFESSV